jgi:hypothetical protein
MFERLKENIKYGRDAAQRFFNLFVCGSAVSQLTV